jgi:hypothetical protein
MLRALGSLMVLGVIVSGCAGSHVTTTTTTRLPRERPSQAARPVPGAETRITGGSKVQRAELGRIVRAIGPTGLGALTVEPATHRWTSRHRGAVFLAYTRRAKDIESWWEAQVIGQAFAIQSARASLPPVTAVEGDLGGGRITIGRRGNPPRWSPVAITRAVETAARGQHAAVTVLRVVALNGRPVTRLRLRVRDPARFLAQRLPLILAALPDYDAGQFVEVTDTRGNLALVAGQFVNGGMGGSVPPFQSCGPFTSTGTVGYDPPPCPFTGARVFAYPGSRPARSASDDAAKAAARAGEKVTSLVAAPTAAQLCTSYRIAPCPHVAGTTWVATLTHRSGRNRVERWLMISDATGRVVRSGTLPA